MTTLGVKITEDERRQLAEAEAERAEFAGVVGELATARAERDAAERERDRLLEEIRLLFFAVADVIAGHKS